MKLNGLQRKYLRGLAHSLSPVVLIGISGVTDALLMSVQEQLAAHELIKIKFIANKDKAEKERLRQEIATRTNSDVVGVIGHCASLFAPNPDKAKRKIQLPSGSPSKNKPKVIKE